MKGIGIYWCLIEIIHEQEGIIKFDEINSIAYELQEDENNILSVIKDFDLFVIREYDFGNTRVSESLNERYKISEKATKAVNKRWEMQNAKNQEVNTTVLPKTYERNTIREDKIKEDKRISKKILFKDSPYFDKLKFKNALPEWSKEKLKYYFESLEAWSNEGNKKIDWIATARTWASRDEREGKIKFKEDVKIETLDERALRLAGR